MVDYDGVSTDVLFRVLLTFSFREINLTKLESRPRPGQNSMMNNLQRRGEGFNVKQFQHMFYIDFEASMAESGAQHALTELQEFTTFLKRGKYCSYILYFLYLPAMFS